MPDRDKAEQTLREDLQRAQERMERALENVKQVTSDIPSGIPYPDNVARIQIAGHERTQAMIAFRAALRRWNDFVLRWRIPEDF